MSVELRTVPDCPLGPRHVALGAEANCRNRNYQQVLAHQQRLCFGMRNARSDSFDRYADGERRTYWSARGTTNAVKQRASQFAPRPVL